MPRSHVVELSLRLIAFFLAQYSYCVLGFNRPYYFATAHKNQFLARTTDFANMSNRLRIPTEASPSIKDILVQSSKSHPRKKTRIMISSMVATSLSFLMIIKPAAASTATAAVSSALPSYHLTKILFLRLLAIVYIAAFSVAKNQNRGLIGDNGISPARSVLNDSQQRQEQKSTRRKEWLEERKKYARQNKGSWLRSLFLKFKHKIDGSRFADLFCDKFWFRTDRVDRPLPCLLWLASDRNNLNPWLDGLANAGLLLSAIMLATGSANVLLILALWIIQRSFMSVGGVFYGYGWEPQLAELTFHALFLVPLLSMDPFFGSKGGLYPVPLLVIWAIRFYLFKIMLGAGLIKIKSSDAKWKFGNMTTMYFFYETQPVPNPFTRFFHFLPKWWHRFEVWTNHFVELVAPFLLLLPFRSWRIAGGLIQILFQLTLIMSGNLSFLNWLTIVPAILCLDDAFLVNNLPSYAQKLLIRAPMSASIVASIKSGSMHLLHTPTLRKVASVGFFLLMTILNVKVVQNLFARRQLMNTSFDKLRLCGTYGAFGVVSEAREELIIESAEDIKGPWKEYSFNVKPGNIYRPPRWISPYHYRLDWQLWIASQTGRIERNLWILNLLLKLLQQEKDVIELLDNDPWSGSNAVPKYIRIDKYRYRFFDKKNDISADGSSPFWVREKLGRYFPKQGVLTEQSLKDILMND